MTQPARLTIDIYSDVMCPWCIIGYRQLQKALHELEGELSAEVRWLPFELNPDMPSGGEGQAEHIARKYGRTPQQAAESRGQMHAIGERAGYSFAYAGAGDPPPAKMWNTFAAHKLLKWALIEAGAEVQNKLKLALFDAHFQERRNVSDPEVLVDIAASQGLDRDGARAALDDDALSQIVRAEEARAWDMNISGVPAMIVQGKFLIPGAQEPEVYANALRRIAAKEAAAQTADT
ncbi:DsbA family oxidoreductase [Novosphingobium sp.]|uniref:DsbA family oxidoreductase n=1 Tax=Novosphingobium sp. TaxID=1874826 RepID=UPI0025FCC7AD|nr:DsbA family oxidoreductase [Novosphingobium sp.]